MTKWSLEEFKKAMAEGNEVRATQIREAPDSPYRFFSSADIRTDVIKIVAQARRIYGV